MLRGALRGDRGVILKMVRVHLDLPAGVLAGCWRDACGYQPEKQRDKKSGLWGMTAVPPLIPGLRRLKKSWIKTRRTADTFGAKSCPRDHYHKPLEGIEATLSLPATR